MKEDYSFEKIGGTLDDAVGEAYDKVARVIGLPYPGGVMIDKVSRDPSIETFPLPKPKVDGYNLSYSGLKSHLVRMIEKEEKKVFSDTNRRHVTFSGQGRGSERPACAEREREPKSWHLFLS